MDRRITLTADKIKFEIINRDTEPQWNRFFLINIDRINFLGATHNYDIINKMLPVLLAPSLNKCITIYGRQLTHLISLSETYATLFITQTPPYNIYIVYDGKEYENKDIVLLEDIDLKLWYEKIDQFINIWKVCFSSSVYSDGKTRYVVDGHHTTVASEINGTGTGFNMGTPTEQQPSATNVYWWREWYEIWKTVIEIIE